jgi:hypothetical protein
MDNNCEIYNLDTSWLDNFNMLDNEYKNYYREDLTFLKINAIYINSNNEIEKLTEEKIYLKIPNLVTKNEVLSIIKKYCVLNNIKYTLLTILKYNIDLEPWDLNLFLRENTFNNNYLLVNKNIDDIKFEKSISLFHDLNNLMFIFYKKEQTQNIISKQITKKIFIRDNNRKTRKK